MAGVFDIDLDQPEENVSDDENEEVGDAAGERRDVEAAAQTLHARSGG